MPFYVEKPKTGLSARRMAVVNQAFTKLDKDNSGAIDVHELIEYYDVNRHPLVVNGTLSPSAALEAFARQFEPVAATRDGRITFDEFLTYYTKVSVEVDRGREIDKDGFFEDVVRRSWRLDEDEMPVLSRTNLIPTTLELPSGLARAKGMDLMFMGPDGRTLTGFKGCVKTVFARNQLPEELQGYFALYGELERRPFQYLPVRPATLPPYDFVWPTESGDWVGFRSVINSSINLQMLPEELRQLIRTRAESQELGVTYLPTAENISNPHFTRSSDIYGEGLIEECAKLAELKTKTFNGTAAGTKYQGRTGKFTHNMPSPSPSAGLNCGTVKKAWGL